MVTFKAESNKVAVDEGEEGNELQVEQNGRALFIVATYLIDERCLNLFDRHRR